MQTISQIRAMLDARGLRPRQRFGQNFLHDQNQLRKLVEAAGLGTSDEDRGRDARATDLVLEVGPGTGTLTEALVEMGADVIACEIDRDLADVIRERFEDRVVLIEGDCLDGKHAINPEIGQAVGGRRFKLVSNLPYNAATPLIVNLLIDYANIEGMFVTIQKEVADRLLARPSTKDYGPLSIITQAFARVEMVGVVPPSCFWPEPDVTSAMVSIVPERDQGINASRQQATNPPSKEIDRRAFAKFVTGLFTKRRKQLGAVFGRDRSWPPGVAAEMRPEALTPRQAIALHAVESTPTGE